MPSERVQRQIDSLLDEAEQAMRGSDWPLVRARCEQVLALDPENADAPAYLHAALRALGTEAGGSRQSAVEEQTASAPSVGEDALSSPAPETRHNAGPSTTTPIPGAGGSPALRDGDALLSSDTRDPKPDTRPATFVDGRYEVIRFLGQGGKKQVYLALDKTLNREVAFALIKTEGLDAIGRQRILREGQAMGTLGAHPHIVTVFDLGESPATGNGRRATSGGSGQPYMVTELMRGGDVEGVIEKAREHRLTLDRALKIADEVCAGLEFAHSRGIVHRDLKPGNVWLTEDGVAKIGDFGLAVAMDRTRLTQAGMMVGTVGYMPPEQATGGAVTPRSDLYSLGAMLYEMVTGRPPFIGDDAVAIIGQHLNTSPISPAWHRKDCPPGLEALIMRLLEKDPSRRPASATEVRAALQSVAGAIGRDPSSPALLPQGRREPNPLPTPSLPTASDNPLYRRAFVGREGELRQLQGAFDAALSGRGSLAMVVGEPGIGKTAVCEQLATYVALRGGRALVGHCYEEGSLSLPYLPFVEAMRSYVLQREPEGLRADLGSGAGEVARIVSEVRDRVQVAPAAGGDPDEDRWRLLQALTAFLRNASLVQPLFILLEDLHDADRGTLDLLVHLARNLDGARVLIAGTYRDIEVDRSHPLSSALAELRRGQNFLRVPLRGLTAEEVQRMMAAVAQREIPWPFAELVHRQTEGNPLFVQEMLRYLVEEGLVAEREGALRRVGDDSLAGRIPEGLRDVIGKRLSRLSEQTNQALSIASVVGREFRLDVLQRVANLPEEAVEAALEQASGVAVVEQRPVPGTVGFRFTHAFFRQTLYEEIFVPRRIRLHQQVARALEAVYGRRVDEHAAELAEHFAQTTDREDLEKALHYFELAADRALAAFAYGDAVRHLQQALKVQDVLDPDDTATRCDLLLALGEAILPDEDPGRAATIAAPEAFALAESLGDSLRAARAAVLALTALRRTDAAIPRFASGSAPEWLARADRHAAAGTPERVLTDAYAAIVLHARDGAVAAHPLYRKAAAEAIESGDGLSFYMPVALALRFLQAVQDREARFALADAVLHRSRQGARSGDLGDCLSVSGYSYLDLGDRETAERLWDELTELAGRSKDATVRLSAGEPAFARALMDGRLDEVVSLVADWDAVSEQQGTHPTFTVPLLSAYALLFRGRVEEVLAIPAYAEPGAGRPNLARRALGLAHAGRHEEARAIRDRFKGIESDEDETSATIMQHLLEAAILGRDRETVATLSRRLAVLAGSAAVSGHPIVCARLLGEAALLLGDREQARAYFAQAIDVATRTRFRPELALSHLGLAEVLLDAGHGPRVTGHGDGEDADADAGHGPRVTGHGDGEDADADAGHGPRVTGHGDGGDADADAGHGPGVTGHGDGAGAEAAGEQAGETTVLPDSAAPPPPDTRYPPPDTRVEALRHLDFAVAEFREMKMQPSLERALRHKEVLKA